MSSGSNVENVLIQVRSLLRDNDVKLWLSPYYETAIGCNEQEIENLAQTYCILLDISREYCLAALHELQSSALDKLRARDDFSKTGIATLKVRVPGQIGGTQLLTIHVKLTDPGSVLHTSVAKELAVPESRIKLICAGKVLDSDKTLQEQCVKNNQQMMAILLEVSATEATASEVLYEKIRKAKDDAKLLSDPKNEHYMHMEDQQGNAIHLPPEERQSLMIALALHEKGKAALNRNEYSGALVWFLEADEALKKCNSQLLNSVDNYAILNLDIVWCYMCLKSVTQLPDVENRLSICENNFKRTYGENFNRVQSIKGSSVQEKALFVRLHLLQGVLYYHQNRRTEAKSMLQLVSNKLNHLKVDESSVNVLMEMGYTVHEARLGLRSTDGNINDAINYISSYREDRQKARKRAKQERSFTSLSANSEKWVNPRSLNSLVEMGFDKSISRVALLKADNDIAQAISLIQRNYDELLNEVPKTSIASIINEMKNMGFDVSVVRNIIKQFKDATTETILNKLIEMQTNGTYEQEVAAATSSSDSDQSSAAGSSGLSTRSTDTDQSDQSESEQQAKAAYKRLAADVSNEDDAYSDLPLIEEERILNEYKNYLNM